MSEGKKLLRSKDVAHIHTKFLVHWTDRKFLDPNRDDLDNNLRHKYVERLIDILEKGFYMNIGTEKIYGSLKKESIQGQISRTCFTEIRLSSAKKHAKTYGKLGIGVDRDFVIQRYGNPVFYVMNGDYSNVVTCAAIVRDFLKKNDKSVKYDESPRNQFETLLGYLKNMNEKNENELTYYDELEWRITHLTRLEKEYVVPENRKEHIYRIKLSKEDIKVIVFPDSSTMGMALNDDRVLKSIDNPNCVTLSDCENF
jgi:hypothetical protein